jgi:KDO2-lipid IV(A) lauroyltransferase
MGAKNKPLYHFWTPNYWFHWLALGLIRLICLLPYRVQTHLFKSLGRLAHRFDTRRRTFARRNVELCFPESSRDRRDALVLAHYEALGVSMMELGLAWWASDESIAAMLRIEGAEHLTDALANGQAVILLTGHFTPLELTGRALRNVCPEFDCVYQEQGSEFLVELLRLSRGRSVKNLIANSDVRGMVRCLLSGRPLWFAPDQTVRSKQSVLVSFFGEPALTNSATSKLARMGKAIAIPFFVHRLPQGGYLLKILPPIEDFPSDDPVEDTRRYVAILEQAIRQYPEQYIWTYRKFKGRPEQLPDAYADLDELK